MSVLSQFITALRSTRVITNRDSAGGTAPALYADAASMAGSKEVLSGALTAATLSTLVTIAGSGEVGYLSAYTKDTTARTLRLQVVVDGVTAFDSTSASTSTSTAGIVAAGFPGSSTSLPRPAATPIRFNNSLLIKVASSLSETNKVAIAYAMQQF